MKDSPKHVQSLHVIYDVDGTPTGEIVYLFKKMLGLAHCAACAITHGARREKPEFTRLKQACPVPVYNIHRDEMDDVMRGAVEGVLPCVVARTAKMDVRVMGPEELERCGGDVVAFERRIGECVKQRGLEMREVGIGGIERIYSGGKGEGDALVTDEGGTLRD